MRNTALKNTLICFLTFLFYASPYLFAQGKEWERVRTTIDDSTLTAGTVTQVEYFIAAGDTMEVFVWKNPDLSKDVIVGPDGKISYPLVGRIQAVGLTIDQLEEKITQELSKYVKYPQVSVMIKEFSGNKIIILGEVSYPGIYTYKGTINLIEAVALAGDFTKDARQDSVMVVSGNLTYYQDIKRINMSQVIREGTSEGDIILQPNDVVYVPKSFIANFNKFLDNINPFIDRALGVLNLRREIKNIKDE